MSYLNEANLLEMFLEMLLSERCLSRNTASAYLNDLQNLLLYFNPKGASVLTLSSTDLISYIAMLGVKNTSVARKISAIKQFYSFLTSEGIIHANPAADLQRPKIGQFLPKSLDLCDVEALLDAASEDSTPHGIRDCCILEMMYSTGMRVSEVLGIKMEAILAANINEAPESVISISGKGNKERMVVINYRATNALRRYLALGTAQKSNYLFPSHKEKAKAKHLTRQMFFISLKKLAARAGIDPSQVSPHKLRHSFASHMLQNGAELRIVQSMMGHSSIASTQIYTKVLSTQAKELLAQHPLSKLIT